MSEIGRRGLLKVIGSVPLAGLVPAPAAVAQAGKAAKAARGKAFTPQFFTAHEYATVRVLVDLVIPKDERSGSATDAGVPEFMDFIMVDPLEMQREREKRQTSMRGGLAWLDHQCRSRFDKTFLECTEAQRREVLDDIAWPAKAKPELSHGVAFFNRMRDMTAAGFFSSKMGVQDLRYMGNVPQAKWDGCPPEALKKLGVTGD
jgi:gluconate 2-dehydrogenase subunit 3-like protein